MKVGYFLLSLIVAASFSKSFSEEEAMEEEGSSEEVDGEVGMEENEEMEEKESMNNDQIETEEDMEEDKMKMSSGMSCGCKEEFESLSELIKDLQKDLKSIKSQVSSEGCTAPEGNSTSEEYDSLDSMEEMLNTTDLEEGYDEDNMTITTTQAPIECDLPFQMITENCYFFLYHPQDWKSWGDSQAYCQSLGGVLASPSNLTSLRNYLIENFSNVFWIGAQRATGETNFKWYNDEDFPTEEFASGQPDMPGAKNCIVLESTSRYKAMNNYCGEKFPFICQRK